jgi:hypothetical protein
MGLLIFEDGSGTVSSNEAYTHINKHEQAQIHKHDRATINKHWKVLVLLYK